MSKVSKILGVGLVAGAVLVGGLTVEAAEVTVGADVVSSYVWRGITLNKDAVIQPSVAIEHPSGVALEVWSNFDLGDDDGAYAERQFSEIDFDLSYSMDVEMVTLTLGYIEYTFPGAGDLVGDEETGFSQQASADRELYVGAAAEVLPGLELGLTVYQNLATSDGTYVVLGAEYGYEVLEGLTLALGGTIAYGAEGATAGGESGMHDYSITLSGAYDVAEGVELSAFVTYVDSIDSDALPSAAIREDVFGGVGLYYSF